MSDYHDEVPFTDMDADLIEADLMNEHETLENVMVRHLAEQIFTRHIVSKNVLPIDPRCKEIAEKAIAAAWAFSAAWNEEEPTNDN